MEGTICALGYTNIVITSSHKLDAKGFLNIAVCPGITGKCPGI